ncbi:hypothetical protein BK786_05695 [Bacillus thuringiensis serovar thailandensis]|nr:hypothetical protein TU55_13465 [Bacillus cereus]KMP63239.1 hypothetical protein TU61_27775 [Bacillus cereus]OUA68657.1 hypothetical protein BK786_05695 [Bacillus thuringiensis serovar thailandensis]
MSFCPPIHSHMNLLLFVFYMIIIIHKVNKYLYFSTNIIQNIYLNLIKVLCISI